MDIAHREVTKQLMKEQGFITHDFEYNWDAMTRSAHIAYKYDQLPVSGMPYCIASNVLKDPELFIQLLKQYPATESDPRFWAGSAHHIGYKQSLHAQTFLPLLSMWRVAFKEMFPEVDLDDHKTAASWSVTTNIYSKEMHPAFIPHHDGGRVSNLWLSKGLEHFGTGFYRLKMDGKYFYHVKELTKYNRTRYGVTNRKLLESLSTARFWEENDNWELYAALPAVYNSALIYDGNWFHAGLGIPEEWPEKKIRYSLISLLGIPGNAEPSRVKEDETI
jgi:hypothetical protein